MKIRRLVTGHNDKGQSIVKWENEIKGIPGRTGARARTRVVLGADDLDKAKAVL